MQLFDRKNIFDIKEKVFYFQGENIITRLLNNINLICEYMQAQRRVDNTEKGEQNK